MSDNSLNMKRILYFIVLVFILSAGLGVVLYYGNQTSPVSRIAIETYPNIDAFTDQVVSNLRAELKTSSVLVLGVMPEDLEGFEFAERLKALVEKTELDYQVVVIETGLGPEGFFPNAVSVSLANEKARLAEGIKNAQSKSLRTLVIAPSTLTTQLGIENHLKKFQQDHGLEVMSLTVAPLMAANSGEKTSPLPCKTEHHDRSGIGSLGCAIQQISREHDKFPMSSEQYTAVFVQLGASDFLALIHRPQGRRPQ